MRRRRQTGGLVPRRVTFRLTMLLPALLLGSTVLAMIAHHVAWMLRHHGFCAAVRPTASGLYSDRQRLLVEGQADGLQDRDAASSGSLEDGPDVGVEPGTPMRAEAVGDLAEDDAGAQRLFRPVVGRRHRPVGEEDEQVLPVLLDDSEQFLALPVGRLDLEQPVELGFQLRGINGESGRGEAVTPVADGYGLLQQVLDAGRKADVASVDGVLDIAQQMSKAAWCPVRAQPICAPSRSDTQKSGRTAPRNSPTTALPRLGRIRKQALSPLWKTQVHQVFLPTRALVSSDCRMVPDNSRSRIRLVWCAKALPLASSMLARAPSLISNPSKSEISRANRSNGIAWAKRKYSTKARRFGPNGEPGSNPSGAAALNRRAQHGQTPPCNVIRVTSGTISGISIRS